MSLSNNFTFVLALYGTLALEGLEYGFLAIDPILQGTGIAMAGVGVASSHKNSTTTGSALHPKVSLAPMWMSGPALGLSVTSW